MVRSGEYQVFLVSDEMIISANNGCLMVLYRKTLAVGYIDGLDTDALLVLLFRDQLVPMMAFNDIPSLVGIDTIKINQDEISVRMHKFVMSLLISMKAGVDVDNAIWIPSKVNPFVYERLDLLLFGREPSLQP